MCPDPIQSLLPGTTHVFDFAHFTQNAGFRGLQCRMTVLGSRLRVHLFYRRSSAFMVAHAQFQPKIASDEEDGVECRVVTPSPRCTSKHSAQHDQT